MGAYVVSKQAVAALYLSSEVSAHVMGWGLRLDGGKHIYKQKLPAGSFNSLKETYGNLHK